MKPTKDMTVTWCAGFVFCILAWVCGIYGVLWLMEYFNG
jgi:hypothetical protein